MDGLGLGFFLFAAFIGGVASGVAGFAFGFIVSGVWLHFITPVQTTLLIVGYGLCTQSYGVWKVRHSLKWRNVAPFIVAGTISIPIGTLLLTRLDPAYMRIGIGGLLLVYGAYGLAKPAFKPVQAGLATDSVVGFANGLLCGLTGLPGFIITVWCQMRGWTKDAQRAVFQPVILASMTVTAAVLGISGAVTVPTIELFATGLPAVLGGLWLGFRLYGRLDEAAFRKLILVLLLVSGAALIAAQASIAPCSPCDAAASSSRRIKSRSPTGTRA